MACRSPGNPTQSVSLPSMPLCYLKSQVQKVPFNSQVNCHDARPRDKARILHGVPSRSSHFRVVNQKRCNTPTKSLSKFGEESSAGVKRGADLTGGRGLIKTTLVKLNLWLASDHGHSANFQRATRVRGQECRGRSVVLE